MQGREGPAHYGTWRERARRMLPRSAVRLLELTPTHGYSPDFLTPNDHMPDFGTGLEQVMSTPRPRVRHELEVLSGWRPRTTWTRELGSGRGVAMKGLGHALHAYHQHAIEPYWASIRSLVRADHQQQVSNMSVAGVDALLGNLHPSIRWNSPVLEIDGFADKDVHLDGRGVRLQPSVFCWNTPTKLYDPELQPVLVYPVQHTPGLLRRLSAEHRSQPLAALLGTTRAAALESIAGGCTTTQLAERCQISLAGASRQAGILRDAGLVTTRRAGQAVRHDLTLLGKAVLSGGFIQDPERLN
ncbi:winged helix-turn-helix transcriptional regulator [Kribbella sandramycini]|uniref:DNA-binding transcriptional ArsR family regulator n=1 Tax=Kribbella sandramycini TaxID=60450 RepID=A0A7Y4L2P5_9ACTN|nr:winged helix-turn-helix domain-containing protein [Kribbella sandramycini]MBB6571328.1 DNA-binding transcriptional ArsR family regulator [Kribbella sandramycini]NOL43269.1 winged helix-turn-helix transcriptional regulator [Kribbella sandramycini]